MKTESQCSEILFVVKLKKKIVDLIIKKCHSFIWKGK